MMKTTLQQPIKYRKGEPLEGAVRRKIAPLHATWRDYLALSKWKVVALMLLTVVIGMCMAVPGWPGWRVLLFGNLGIALCAAGAAAMNHLADRHVDAQMARTAGRPLPEGRISVRQALVFAVLLSCAGEAILFLQVNALTAVLTLAALLGYAVVYTLYLKRATPQNIVIGGLAGAAPPLLGWTAVTGTVHPYALLLVLIIFVWTPPHFWALALYRRKEYEAASIPMLPVTHGDTYTRRHILLYTLLLLAASLLPFAVGMSGLLYLLIAVALGGGYLYQALRLMYWPGGEASRSAFRYSIVYLMALFGGMLLDHYLLNLLLLL